MRKQKPIIGVTTSIRNAETMWFFIRLGIWLAGGRAVRITAQTQTRYLDCAGYVIAGGVDIDPSCYGEANTASYNMEPERDTLEKEIIKHAFQAKKPLMGICRGAQMINVVKGGNLYQDARDFYEYFVPANSVIGKIFSRRTIYITKDSVLLRACPKPKWLVNSLHHQAINRLGEGLAVTAEDDHGIVQAIENTVQADSYVLGVQWHPEFMLHRTRHRNLFRELVKQSGG